MRRLKQAPQHTFLSIHRGYNKCNRFTHFFQTISGTKNNIYRTSSSAAGSNILHGNVCYNSKIKNLSKKYFVCFKLSLNFFLTQIQCAYACLHTFHFIFHHRIYIMQEKYFLLKLLNIWKENETKKHIYQKKSITLLSSATFIYRKNEDRK